MQTKYDKGNQIMPFIGQEPLTGAYHVLDSITASATATYNCIR